MIDQPWTDTSSILLQQQVLTTLADTDDTHAVDIAHTLNTGPDEISGAFRQLIAQGLAAGFSARGGDADAASATITAAGKDTVRQWSTARTPGRIKKACRAAMLDWLDELDEEPVGSTEDFLSDVRAHYYGVRFNSLTVIEEARYLQLNGLITGRAVLGAVLKPVISGLGRAVLSQHAGDLTAWEASQATASSGSTINYNVTATNANLAHNSPGAQQTITASGTDPRDLVLAIAEALQQLQANQPSIDADQAQTLADQLRTAANNLDTDDGRRQTRGLLHNIQALIINATGSAAGQGLYELATQAIQQLG